MTTDEMYDHLGLTNYVTVYTKGTNDILTNLPLAQILFLFDDPDGFTNQRVVDAWMKNGEWHFEIQEI